MRIVIKPLGAIALLVAIVTLSIIAFTNQRKQAEAAGVTPVTVAAKSNPAVAATLPGQMMYKDGFENSWELYGWAKEIKANDSKNVHGGIAAIQAVLKPFEGIKLYHQKTNLNGFDRISFYVYCEGNEGQLIQVGAENGTLLKAVNVEPLPYGKWVSVTVPLSELGVKKDGTVNGFWIKEAVGKTITSLSIDDVRLLAPTDPAPAGPSCSYSADTPAK